MIPLFVPADRPERFGKAAASGADAIILDLEDAVAPQSKARARGNLRADFTTLPVLVRINAVGTPFHDDDLLAATHAGAAAIVVPKAEDNEGFGAIARNTSLPVLALVETAAGVAGSRTIASLPFVGRLVFGSIDFCADLGCAHTREALLAARSELVFASRLARLTAPIDGVTARIDDPAASEDDARYASDLGFGGKLCIHPRQIEGIRRGFQPTGQEISWARGVLASGDGAAAVDGILVDAPVRARAEAVLKRAKLT
ncbi:MAG: CoA ester lyase [Mesorhizobium sp.]